MGRRLVQNKYLRFDKELLDVVLSRVWILSSEVLKSFPTACAMDPKAAGNSEEQRRLRCYSALDRSGTQDFRRK